MFAAWENGWGLELSLSLAETRGPLGDALANALNFSGGTLFFLILIPGIYWCLHRDLGARLLFVLILSYTLGLLLKAQFQAPRPVDIAPQQITPLFEQGGYGFPSNHVILALAIWGYLALHWRRRRFTLLVAMYVLAQMWSRVYAGVHYFHDVLGGVLFGGVALWLFLVAAENLPAFWKRRSIAQRVVLALGSSALVYFVLPPGEESAVAFGLSLGGGLGIILLERIRSSISSGSTPQRLLRFFVGLAVLLAFFYATRALFAIVSPDDTTLTSLLRSLRYTLTVLLGFVYLPRFFLSLRLAPPAA